jgi:hypothetical protein
MPFLVLQAVAQESGDGAEAKNSCPCCGGEYRQFDFWLGDWNTYNANGRLVGTNNIVLLQDSCIVQENWESNGFPYSGTSYNFYDADKAEWVQVWVDNQGGSLQLYGGLENGSMVLQSKAGPVSEDSIELNRITWTPNEDGTVRQHWETTKDNGETWTTLFDGLYRKKDAE